MKILFVLYIFNTHQKHLSPKPSPTPMYMPHRRHLTGPDLSFQSAGQGLLAGSSCVGSGCRVLCETRSPISRQPLWGGRRAAGLEHSAMTPHSVFLREHTLGSRQVPTWATVTCRHGSEEACDKSLNLKVYRSQSGKHYFLE